MRTIALISQKGGAGKTTFAVALAVAGERTGLSSGKAAAEVAELFGWLQDQCHQDRRETNGKA